MTPMSSIQPLISLIIPIYGVEKYMERCARSLFEQTYENLEFIFVNDCTKDTSVDILNDVIDEYPSRKHQIRIINHKHNLGLAGARNTGVENASGEFICHIDSDDWVSHDLISRCYEIQQKNNADIVSTNAKAIHVLFTEKMKRSIQNTPVEIAKNIVSRNSFASIWGLLVRRSLYVDNNIKCELGRNYGEDYLITPKLYYYAKNVASINECLYFYNCTNGSSYVHNAGVKGIVEKLDNIELLNVFFIEKDPSFNDAVKTGTIAVLLEGLLVCSSIQKWDEYYRIKGMLPNDSSTFLSNLPFVIRGVFILKDYPKLLRFYSKTIFPISRVIGIIFHNFN